MPEFFIIIARKYFPQILGGRALPDPPPVSYAYDPIIDSVLPNGLPDWLSDFKLNGFLGWDAYSLTSCFIACLILTNNE